MQTVQAEAERVRKGVTVGTEHGGVRPRRTFEIRWGSAYHIQKSRACRMSRTSRSRREGAQEGRGRDSQPGIIQPRLSPSDPKVRPAGIFLGLDRGLKAYINLHKPQSLG